MDEHSTDEGVVESEQERNDALHAPEDEPPPDHRIDPPDDAPPPVAI